MRYAVISDIHGNMHAFREIINDMESRGIAGVIFLGDLIDYGMQSNEVIEYIQNHFTYQILCNIWGNHEKAVLLSDFGRFSSERGVVSAKRTRERLQHTAKDYLNTVPVKNGFFEFKLAGRKCLAVHGSIEDVFWKPIAPEAIYGDYSNYDIVFSGHSHVPHVFTKFYPIEDEKMRNKCAVLFLNPGSVGQPRNHNPKAQYAIFDADTLTVELRAVPYDVDGAMALYDNSVDVFYRDRLKIGV